MFLIPRGVSSERGRSNCSSSQIVSTNLINHSDPIVTSEDLVTMSPKQRLHGSATYIFLLVTYIFYTSPTSFHFVCFRHLHRPSNVTYILRIFSMVICGPCRHPAINTLLSDYCHMCYSYILKNSGSNNL